MLIWPARQDEDEVEILETCDKPGRLVDILPRISRAGQAKRDSTHRHLRYLQRQAPALHRLEDLRDRGDDARPLAFFS